MKYVYFYFEMKSFKISLTAEENGISTSTFLKTTDKDNSNPLHAAVSSGDSEV
jgi:hypothetical protein